jgi:DNA invertase Pin-like site-specific DNA recombinase
MTFHIYLRVSTTQQARPEHVSLEVQQQKCMELYTKEALNCHGHNYFVYSDTRSGRNPEKLKAQQSMLSQVKAGDIVCVYSFDRLSRDVGYAAELLKRLDSQNVILKSVMEPLDHKTPSGRYQFINLVNTAEYASRQLGQKVREALNMIRQKGGHVGQVPYGWMTVRDNENNVNRKVLCEPEQRVIMFIHGLRGDTMTINALNGKLRDLSPQSGQFIPFVIDGVNKPDKDAVPYSNIADLLNEYDVPYRKNKPWTASIVSSIINNDHHTTETDRMDFGFNGMSLGSSMAISRPIRSTNRMDVDYTNTMCRRSGRHRR